MRRIKIKQTATRRPFFDPDRPQLIRKQGKYAQASPNCELILTLEQKMLRFSG